MKISTKGRYGLRILIDLATHDPEKPRLLKDIVQSQLVSEKYLSRLVLDLRRAKLIRSVRGSNGGFYLARSPETITLLEILETMEGPIRGGLCDFAREMQPPDAVPDAKRLAAPERRHPGGHGKDHARRHPGLLPNAECGRRLPGLLYLRRRPHCSECEITSFSA